MFSSNAVLCITVTVNLLFFNVFLYYLYFANVGLISFGIGKIGS